jgi:hypothetical protein
MATRAFNFYRLFGYLSKSANILPTQLSELGLVTILLAAGIRNSELGTLFTCYRIMWIGLEDLVKFLDDRHVC